MEFFFKPQGVAIVGASANPSKGGYFILKNVLKGFSGGVYPVNPGYPEIDGLKCYPSVLFHIFVGGDTSGANVSHLVEMARKAGKPLFGWIMGKRDEAHKFQLHAKELGLPVFGELYRAVECMAAVISRRKMH